MSSFSCASKDPSSSLQNSISSSSNSVSSFSATSYTRCHGLDLLVRAVHHVDGSVSGVPFVRKQVLIRRRRRTAAAYAFSDFVVNELLNNGGARIAKRQRRTMAMPSKYKDSVVEPWSRFQVYDVDGSDQI